MSSLTVVREKIAFLRGEGGLPAVAAKVAATIYDRTVRRCLPRADPILYAGLPTGLHRAWGDRWLPGFLVRQDLPDFEAGLVAALRSRVRGGDRVVIVGAGNGVTTAVAALAAGASGTVTCFEGDAAGIAATRRTLAANGVEPRVDLRHVVVGAPIRVYGGAPSVTVVASADLPDCDVLELDCEGAEAVILPALAVRPRAIAVETHGRYGAPSAEVRGMLEALGYRVTDLGWAEPRLERLCRRDDVRVLLADRFPA